MATEFGIDMRTQLEAFRNQQETEKKARSPAKRSAITFECEASGIDLVVSRIAGGKCTMKLFIYLSQPDEVGYGTAFIKTMRDGTMKKATVENLTTFFNGLEGTVVTGCNAIPELHSGKKAAEALMRATEPLFIELAKEGLINTMISSDTGRYYPWYYSASSWHSNFGYGCGDRHAKLIRHMVDAMAKKLRIPYYKVLAKACASSSYGYNYDYYSKDCGDIWAFSMLADLFDEPYAKKCFDEYLDNERLNDISYRRMYSLFDTIVVPRCGEWSEVVKGFKADNVKVKIDKNRFWEYLQQSIGMGLGKKLGNFLSLYEDYIRQAYACDKVIRDKYPEHLQEAHDIYTEKYTYIQNFTQTEKMRALAEKGSRLIDQEHNGYQLKCLRTVREFYEEAQQNCNCVASYVDKTIAGKCWIASFRKIGEPVTQLTVEVDPKGEMVQIKGKYNRDATPTERGILKAFQETLTKNFKA